MTLAANLANLAISSTTLVTLENLITASNIAGQVFTATGNNPGWANAATVVPTAVTTQFNVQTGTTYTPVLTDGVYAGSVGAMILMNNSAQQIVTIPEAGTVAFPVGTVLNVGQFGVGIVTFTPAAGVTINSAGGLLSIGSQFSAATLIQTSTDTWWLLGTTVT